MEILSPSYYFSSSASNWLLEESSNRSNKWTPQENKIFENALAVYDKDTPDRWQRVADLIPGKTVLDVMKQYKELEDDVSSIEAGLIPVPGYSASGFTLDWGSSHSFEEFKQSYCPGGKRSVRPQEQERKKGVPWTEEEHKLFLMGLKKYGKGDWRNISRNFVITRTPTQVASHAQKYFIRQLSGGKDKRRASIHDITTVNLNDHQTTTSTTNPDGKRPSSPDKSTVHSQHPNSSAMSRPHFQWNHSNGSGGSAMSFNSSHGSMIMSDIYGIDDSYGLKMQGYNGSRNMGFQVQSSHHYPRK